MFSLIGKAVVGVIVIGAIAWVPLFVLERYNHKKWPWGSWD